MSQIDGAIVHNIKKDKRFFKRFEHKEKTMEHVKDAVLQFYEKTKYRCELKDEIIGCSTGFRDFDSITDGLQTSDLIVIGGRPSVGKTTFALNIALNMAIRNKLPVAIFSLEMSKQQLVQRMMCSESEVPIKKIKCGNLQNKDWVKFGNAMENIAEAPVYTDDTSNSSLDDIKAKCHHLKKEIENLGLVIIDNFQLIEANKDERISKSLKALATELNVPIIVLLELSRKVDRRKHCPFLSDLKDSGLEEDADVVMLIHRFYDFEKFKYDSKALIIVAKNKNGENGSFELIFQNDIPKFKNTIDTSFDDISTQKDLNRTATPINRPAGTLM